MTYAAIRVRGRPDVDVDIRYTMDLLGLNRVNHCVILPEDDCTKGMLQKAKDYITWGEIDAPTLAELIRVRGRLAGGRPITDGYLAEKTEFKSIDEMAEAVIGSGYRMRDVEDAKPVFRLHPPVKGYEGNKRSFRNGGALGYRGGAINDLVARML